MIDVYQSALGSAQRPPVRDAFALLEECAGIFNRHKRLFLIALGSLLALLMLTLLVTPKMYTSDASVIVGMGRQPSTGDAPTNLPILNALMIVSGIQSGETYAELMSEAPVASQVIAHLGLKTTDKALLSRVKIEPVNNTSIIRISATWSSREMSARIANAFATAFIEHERNLVATQAETALNFLSAEMPAAESGRGKSPTHPSPYSPPPAVRVSGAGGSADSAGSACCGGESIHALMRATCFLWFFRSSAFVDITSSPSRNVATMRAGSYRYRAS